MVQFGSIFCTYWILDFDMTATARSVNRKTIRNDNYSIRHNIDLVKLIDMANTAASCIYTNIFISFETSHSYQFKYAHSICYFLYVYNTRMKRKIVDVGIHFNIKIFFVWNAFRVAWLVIWIDFKGRNFCNLQILTLHDTEYLFSPPTCLIPFIHVA